MGSLSVAFYIFQGHRKLNNVSIRPAGPELLAAEERVRRRGHILSGDERGGHRFA
jgi:hypothetical protein